MTVRRNSENRNGATLILSEEELEYLWHKLNCADGHSFNSYKQDYKVPDIDGYNFFHELDRKYTPADQQ